MAFLLIERPNAVVGEPTLDGHCTKHQQWQKKRIVLDTKPVTVEYELTSYGETLEKVITELVSWGLKPPEENFKKT